MVAGLGVEDHREAAGGDEVLDHPDVAEIVAGEPVGVDDEDVVAARLEPVDLGGPGHVEVGDVAELVEDRAAGLAEQQRVDLGAGAGGGRGGGRGERAERREEGDEERRPADSMRACDGHRTKVSGHECPMSRFRPSTKGHGAAAPGRVPALTVRRLQLDAVAGLPVRAERL